MAFTPQTIGKELDIANLAKHNANNTAIKSELDTQGAKLSTITNGAEPNQNAFATINNVVATGKSDALEIVGSTGITITTSPTNKRVTITATGTAAPGAHGSTHGEGGSDPILELVALQADVGDVTARLAEEAKKDTKNQLINYCIDNTLNKLYRGQSVKIVVTGDSLSAGSGASHTDLDWSSLVESAVKVKFKQSSITWTTSAVGGTTSTYLKDNWSTLVTGYTPDLIIVSHGTNDTALTEAERRVNYKFFVDQAKINGAELLFVTNSSVRFTPDPYGNTPDTKVILREDMAEQTRRFAREFKVGLCDANQTWRRWLSDRNLTTNSTLLHYDHIHPNDLGHRLIAYEVLNAFNATIDNVRELDRRYGGKGWDLYGKVTFRDLTHKLSNICGWGTFDLQHQLVDWGGMWSIEDYHLLPFKKAKLWGTRAVTGSEPYENNYVDDMHIIPVDKDYIEIEVKDVKRVWFSLEGSSATDTAFKVMVNGTKTLDFNVSKTAKAPIEVPFLNGGTKYFPKGVHTVRVERVGNLPASQHAVFNGFLVNFYGDSEPEYFGTPTPGRQMIANPSYSDIDTLIETRLKAANIGFVAPLGWSDFDGGFVQLKTGQPGVAFIDFYGTTATVVVKGIVTDNYFSIYIDGVLKGTINAVDPSYGDLTHKYSALGQGKHRLDIVALNAQVNLARVRFSDTLV